MTLPILPFVAGAAAGVIATNAMKGKKAAPKARKTAKRKKVTATKMASTVKKRAVKKSTPKKATKRGRSRSKKC